MSQENVEIARESLLHAGSGDLEAAQRSWEPTVEWDMSGVVGWTEKSVYRGEEVGPFLRAWADSWENWQFDVEDVREAEGEQVFAAIHESGIGVASGASVDQRRYFVITMRGGRAMRVRMFSERADALNAAGLPG